MSSQSMEDKLKLTMLGTVNDLVTDNACFIIEDKGQYFMTDGGGYQLLSQIKRAGYNWMDIRHIFVTHKHIDHLMEINLWGIISMVRMICQHMNRSYDGDAYIYSHAEILDLIRDMARTLLPEKVTRFMDNRLHFIKVHDGEKLSIIGRDFTFFDIHSTKAKQYGFCMQMDGGKKLTCCGDEPYSDFEREYAENSEWMLHEAFCLYSQRDIFNPYEKHLSTVKDACEHAEMLGVKNLILYHTEDRTLSERKKLYMNEGKQYYHGNLFVPDDLESIEL